jgi:uncharacterized membrane-anchored protein YjiN (DUF445 family)
MKRIIIPFFCVVLFSALMAQQTTADSSKTEAVKSQLSSKEMVDNYLKAIVKDKLLAVKTTVPAETTMMTKKIGDMFEPEYHLEQIKRTYGLKV